MTNDATWQSPSGPVRFGIFCMSAEWNDLGGVYAFAARGLSGYGVLYVGKASSFRDRLPSHERWREAVTKGATHVLARVIAGEADRCSLEESMIRHLQPMLNTRHRGLAGLFDLPVQAPPVPNVLAGVQRPLPRQPGNLLLGLSMAEARNSSQPAFYGLQALAPGAFGCAPTTRRPGLRGLSGTD